MGEVYFELPNSSIRGIPLISATGKPLDIGLVEVGCKPNHKRAQLNRKKELICKLWADKYRGHDGAVWVPTVYRMIAHYDPGAPMQLRHFRKEIDAMVFYEYLTRQMLAKITEEEMEDIRRVVKNPSIEDIIEARDSERLHRLIVGGNEPKMEKLRGKMAEIFVLKDIEQKLPPGMNLFRNGTIRYVNRFYDNGTEVDGIQTFYGADTYVELLDSMAQFGHVMVVHRL